MRFLVSLTVQLWQSANTLGQRPELIIGRFEDGKTSWRVVR